MMLFVFMSIMAIPSFFISLNGCEKNEGFDTFPTI